MCARHYDEILAAVGAQMSRGTRRNGIAPIVDCAAAGCGVRSAAGSTFCDAHRPAGARVSRAARAREIGRIVQAAEGPVTRDAIAAAVGCAVVTTPPIVRLAIEAGYIRSRRGPSGGYLPGDVPVPPG